MYKIQLQRQGTVTAMQNFKLKAAEKCNLKWQTNLR